VANELILIVEDNDKNRKLMRDVLTFKGYRLAEAETGEDGVRLARELHPDLVLMDIQLEDASIASAQSCYERQHACPAQFDGVANVSNSVFASVRSAVSKPSVNQP
jgi:CheY-like chemotaxis protein